MATMAQENERHYRDANRDYQWHGHAGRGRLRDESAESGERQYAMFNHLAGLLSVVDFTLIGFVVSLVMWLVKRDESEFLDDHGKEAVNFQISLFLYVVVGILVGLAFTVVTLGIGAFLMVPLAILGALFLVILRVIGCICAAIAANRGEFYRYPMCIRLIK